MHPERPRAARRAAAERGNWHRGILQVILRAAMAVEPIRIVTTRLAPGELAAFLGRPFPEMVKFVVDLERRVVAVGGELHADAEALLLDRGSAQPALWGGNYRPGLGEGECIEFTSLINIRPSQGNRSMVVEDAGLRARIQDLVFERIGRGEALP